jgi:hypothetical protein
MPDPEDFIEQLRRSNRRWKALDLAACAALVLAALVGLVAKARERLVQHLRVEQDERLQRELAIRTERGQR